MARIGVSEIVESLGLKDYGTSGYRARAVFHYEPLLRLYKLEIPSLFGLLLRDEGILLDRADPNLFQAELDELLTEFGPLVWPSPDQGSRDHLLKPVEGSRYKSDLVYPRDKEILRGHMRNLILSKHTRPDVDIDALIEKRHKDAKLKVFKNTEPGRLEARKKRSREKAPRTKAGEGVGMNRKISLTDASSELSDISSALPPESDDSVVNHAARKRTRAKSTNKPFQVALRLYQKTTPDKLQKSGTCHSHGTIFLDDSLHTAADCFALVHQHTNTDCTYIEFHLPEDMSLEGRIHIDQNSEETDNKFKRVMAILQEAHKFPGEPSYRTVEVEVGIDTLPEE